MPHTNEEYRGAQVSIPFPGCDRRCAKPPAPSRGGQEERLDNGLSLARLDPAQRVGKRESVIAALETFRDFFQDRRDMAGKEPAPPVSLAVKHFKGEIGPALWLDKPADFTEMTRQHFLKQLPLKLPQPALQ